MRKLTCISTLLVAPAACAAEPMTLSPLAVGTSLVAFFACAAAVYLLTVRRSLERSQDELADRLANSETMIADLQVRRGELERALAAAQAAHAEAEQQRKHSQHTLDVLRQQVERVARVDSLTGVANKTQFMETLGEEIKRSVRQKKPLSVLIGELDFFDDYIKTHGDERAVAVLQSVAKSVAKTFRRAGDLVARIGEARFAVVLPEADEATGQRFAERLRRTVFEQCVPFPSSQAADRLTVSVGMITLPPTRLHDRAQAISDAQAALRSAQQAGYNCVSRAANAA